MIFSKWELRREGTMLFISLFIFLIFGIDGVFTRLEGLIMIFLYFIYLFYIVRSEKKIERAKLALKNLEKERLGLQSFEPVERVSETSSLKKDIAFFIRANYFINWGRIEKISYGFELTNVIYPIKEGDRN
jgi:Ca2+/Na+ antiporter